MNMFNIESYVTPILLSYVDKYVRDFKPADAQVSLWAGGVTLHNLVLKADVLQREVALPFTLVSGRIHELLIQVPWTKIMSEPIVVTINTIECILSLNPPPDEVPLQEINRDRAQVVEAPPGYMQALVRRIVSNIAIRVNSLIVKYVHDDVILSLNVKRLSIDSVGPNWEPTFADIDQKHPAIRRLVRLDDLTLCLDKSDSDGKIRFYHEPLLYRCQLELRVLTRLVSAKTRRASSVSIQLISSRLSWVVNNEQLVLLLRLLRERTTEEVKTPPPAPKPPNEQAPPLNNSASNSAEPAPSESWSEWAWSWLPTWMDREGVEETPAPATPVLLDFTAYFDHMSLVLKIMEVDASGRRRARSICELKATDAVVQSSLCSPTFFLLKMGTRNLTLVSHGRCVCGCLDHTNEEEQTIYLEKIADPNEAPWSWVEEELIDEVVETAVAADEEELTETTEAPESDDQPTSQESMDVSQADKFWQKFAPVIYIEYKHDRSPADIFANPYENPITDFEFSDWEEQITMTVTIGPMAVNVSTGLLHRLAVVQNALKAVPPVKKPRIPMRTLTVEECESLSANLPQMHTNLEIVGLRVRFIPSEHSERPTVPPVMLDVRFPKTNVYVAIPLYPRRVCAAACQIPDDAGPLWQGARVHVTAHISCIQVGICASEEDVPRICARAEIRLVTHSLLNKPFFSHRECNLFKYTVKIQANMCASAARIQAAIQVAASIVNEKLTDTLRHTTLARDALNDDDLVALEIKLEDLSARGYMTKYNNAHFVSLDSVKVSAFHTPTNGEIKQAFLFAGPESMSTTAFLRSAFQWCNDPLPSMIEYVSLLVEPMAISVDALLVAWLSYQPRLKTSADPQPQSSNVRTSSSLLYLLRRKVTPPSSSGRGASRSGSGAELVHVRPRSLESCSERSEWRYRKPTALKSKATDTWICNARLMKLHERLNRLLLTAEIGLTQIYMASSTVSSVDCLTIRDAMERHASKACQVIVLSFGRLSIYSSPQMKYLWKTIKHDQPTCFRPQREQNVIENSFPWKIHLADVYCYTLEVKAGREWVNREKLASGLKSQLKMSRVVLPRPVLDMVSSTITLSVVIKFLQMKNVAKGAAKGKHAEHSRDDKIKYFTSGTDFQPSSLNEFMRGPRRKRPNPEPGDKSSESSPYQKSFSRGPVVSLGVNLHADTPPIVVKLNQDQIQTVSVAIHGLIHIIKLLRRPPVMPRQGCPSRSSHRNLVRSASDMDARNSLSEETTSENRSEQLISIFESQRDPDEEDEKLRTFFWFQWVISHATLVIALPEVKLAFDLDDIICTVDLQGHYNQLKVKVASASVKHYKRTESEEWTPGLLGGRVLEVREPADSTEENNFLIFTITQAQISKLPEAWKEELHPKFFEQNADVDTMWEIYATIAPLEMALQPDLIEHLMFWVQELTPKNYCPMSLEEPSDPSTWQWPFCYVYAGGLRLILTYGEENKNSVEDTLMVIINKLKISPYPENPICRQSINASADAWNISCPVFDGRQYEVLITNFSVRTAQFSQLANQEAIESEMLHGTGSENPARKWSQKVVAPTVTPLVHSVDISCILAPAIYSSGVLVSGPAIELNLLTDCSIELGVERLELIRTLVTRFADALTKRTSSSYFLEDAKTCPYVPYLVKQEVTDSSTTDSEATVSEEVTKSAVDVSRSTVLDSGCETATSQSTYKLNRNSGGAIKKTVSIACFDQNGNTAPCKNVWLLNLSVTHLDVHECTSIPDGELVYGGRAKVGQTHSAKASDYLEVLVTMGVVDLSLYVGEDGSPEVKELRPPPGVYKKPTATEEPRLTVIIDEAKETKAEKSKDETKDSMSASKSLTENIRNADIGKTKLEAIVLPYARKTEGNIPLIHATLQQPNFYYLKKKKQRTIQMSVFNAWIGLGVGQEEGHWNAPLLSTARGSPDPVTGIPPALATLRVEHSSGGYISMINMTSGHGTAQLDIERPILLEVCTDRLQRIKGIMNLIEKNTSKPRRHIENIAEPINPTPLLYKVRRYMVDNQIESVTVLTGQIGVQGSEGAIGWSALQLQAAAGSRPERLRCRGLVSAVVLSAGPPTDDRHIVLKPLMAGAIMDATWETWRKAEGGLAARNPSIRVGVDVDRITLDLRPCDVAAVVRLLDALRITMGWPESPSNPESPSTSSSEQTKRRPSASTSSSVFNERCAADYDPDHHFYKDDLRSGAFKIMLGCQLPMAYQVTLHGNTVAWKYPHPRAVTRLVAFPIPGHNKEVECVLELYCPMLSRWEAHTYFKIPVAEPRDMQLSTTTPDAVFAVMWRVRACSDVEQAQKIPPFEFDAKKFTPRKDPLSADPPAPSDYYSQICTVTAEQLSGVLRVDSYFAPRYMPRARLALRLASLEIHAHNELLELPRQAKPLEGYYVSRPLMRSHRVLTLSIRDTAVHAVLGASSRLLLDTYLSCDILDSATGAMEQLIEEFRVQGTVSLNNDQKLRLRAGDIRVALHVPRVCTLRALANDWIDVYKASLKEEVDIQPSNDLVETNASEALEGRVSLWIHNNCSSALRIGQEETEEVVPLSAGASLAYRWRSPIAPKLIRFAIPTPSVEWRWSTSIPFSVGTWRVKLEEHGVTNEVGDASGIYLYVRVKDFGVRRDMYLFGRITLANMLRQNILYNVRIKGTAENEWQTISSGELNAESIALSVLCNTKYDTFLRIKFTQAETGWTGDIPLRECRKENMPWLVKVPGDGEVPYTSVWFRVIRARTDSRIIATVWPFYILRSHMPLDADVSITSRKPVVTVKGIQVQTEENLRSLVQTASGRGATTHLIAPGTTATAHALTFQYRNIDCPVTREAVSLHYGMTDTTVFVKLNPIATIEEITEALEQWLDQSGHEAHSNWPYSIVTKHWPGTWHPALMQPRCDVNVRYEGVRVGGGCSLELRLCPVVLLANASPIALTLRAHDATPLCRLEPGVAISPPTAVLHKPFFLSVEMGRETFVSGQLQVCKAEPGQYGNPPPGHIALDRAAKFAIHCNQKVALLTMCYEVKEDINVLGITSTYILINRLPMAILVSAMAVPNQTDENSILRPKMYKVIEPTKDESLHGAPLCRFWMRGRWRGGDAEELRTYLCIALPPNSYPTTAHVPVRLDAPPFRRAIALKHENGDSVAVVVTQVRHESRWVVTVAEDPCPQFVVHNRTAKTLAVAQPSTSDPGQASVQPVRECSGVRWWCEVEAGGTTHYSTPAYCARYPPLEQPSRPPISFLTIGQSYMGELYYEWSQPVAIADGEHLLQMSGGVTFKVRVRTHPHSTLVELQDIDQHDLSASDIRRRLIGAFSNESTSLQEDSNGNSTLNKEVHRTSAYENLTEASVTPKPSTSKENEDVTLLPFDKQTDALSASEIVKDDETKREIENSGQFLIMTAQDTPLRDSSLMRFSTSVQNDISESYKNEKPILLKVARDLSTDYSEASHLFEVEEKDWSGGSQVWREVERFRCVVGSISVTIGASADVLPLMAIHLQRAAMLVQSDSRKVRTTISIADVQVDNAQYATNLYDFAVVVTTRAIIEKAERWPPLWGMHNEVFSTNSANARLLLHTCHDKWTVANCSFQEFTEVELKLGPLGLYVEDAYIGAIMNLLKLAIPTIPPSSEMVAIAESRALQCPFRLRKLHLHPVDLNLTLHTAVRIYIALDESPLRLNQFLLQDVMTSSARLTHALTVHYLSAAILGAGWVVGGLELLGAPGALAARVGNAGGGVRGVASAAAGALLRSLSAAAGSLARNLDLLAGDDDHARRAAAARRRPPSSLMAGLAAGITNFAINILGAVGGLAHHPIVGPAVGESDSGATGLRRGLLGAITKPLSATADLVAYAGHGLLSQTGWDPIPQPRLGGVCSINQEVRSRWRRDCVRWSFRLADMSALAGFDALLQDAQLHLLITHKFLVLSDPDSERVVEMIDLKTCTLSPYQGHIVELHVAQKKGTKTPESSLHFDEDNEYQVNAAAMARVARYTGTEGFNFNDARVLTFLTQPGKSYALHSTLAAALQHNNGSHFPLL